MSVPLFYGTHRCICEVCSREGVLLCCDYCPLVYHPKCLSPPILSQPTGYWMCPQCENDMESTKGKQLIRERCGTIENRPAPPKNVKKELGPSRRTGSYNHVYTSGYRGVYSRSGKWNAQIQYNGKKLYLGSFSSEEEAARAYDIAARRYHGSKAILNFQTSESGVSRNPIQMNSKPTSRHNSVVSAGDDYGEYGSESSHLDVNVDSRPLELQRTVVIYASKEESEEVIKDNRKECL
ncbi:hypothetical protein WA538_002152 [Blastocystis sp. DL]